MHAERVGGLSPPPQQVKKGQKFNPKMFKMMTQSLPLPPRGKKAAGGELCGVNWFCKWEWFFVSMWPCNELMTQ